MIFSCTNEERPLDIDIEIRHKIIRFRFILFRFCKFNLLEWREGGITVKTLISGKNPFRPSLLREKSLIAIILLAITFLAASTAGAATFGGWNLNMEYRDLRPEENFAAAYAYACQTCSISQFDAIEVAPGFDKRPVRIGLFDSGRMTQAFPAPLDGTPTGLDLIPGVTNLFGADEEFLLIAKVLSAELIFTPAGPIGHAQVQRYADLTFSQGTVVHEIINTQDEHFILFTAHLSLESTVGGGTIDFRQAGSLGDYVAPYLQTGWSYSSYVLDSDLNVYSEGQASVLGMPGLSWQQYPVASVPIPATAYLLGTALFGLAFIRRCK